MSDRTSGGEQGEGTDLSALPALPAGWCWAQVKEVGEVKLGRQRSPEHHAGPHMRKYLRVANVYEDRLDLSDVLEMNFGPDEYETYRLQYGDVLLNEGQSLEMVGRPAMYRDEVPGACFQNTLVRFRASDAVLPGFALLVFRHYVHSRRFRRIARWTVNIAHLGAGRFAEVEFPVPPLNEQRRIVAMAEELFSDLDAGVAALKRAKAKLKRYRAAVLKAAVEGKLTEEWRAAHPGAEPASVLLERILAERRSRWEAEQLAKYEAAGKAPPKGWQGKYVVPAPPDISGQPELPPGWCWATLECMLREPLRNGHSARESTNGEGIRTLTLTAVTYGDFSESNTKLTVAHPDDVAGLWLEPDDFLIERSNTAELVGTARRFPGPSRYAVFPDLLIRARFLNLVSGGYVETVLQAGPSRIYFRKRAKGLAGNMPKIDQGTILALPFPLPPYQEQGEIATEVERQITVIAATEAQIERDIQRAARLRQSIMAEAFAGRLVPQDPADEPASSLLERIRANRTAAAPSPAQRKGRRRPESTA